VRRGNDELGIESICETGTPIKIDNIKKIEVKPNSLSSLFERINYSS